MPKAGSTASERMKIWVVTDVFGSQMLRKFTPTMMGKSRPFLLNHCHVMVQEAASGDTGAIGGEFQILLKSEPFLPDCIVIHVGDYYLGNKCYDLNGIQLEIETAFRVMQTLLRKQCDKRPEKVSMKLIWSRAIAHPRIGRKEFSFRSAFEALKKINSEVSSALVDQGVGIVKHAKIDPKSCLFFDREGEVTDVAKRQFLRDLNDYLWELQAAPAKFPKLEIMPKRKEKRLSGRPLPEKSMFEEAPDDILDGHKRKKEINKQLKKLEEKLAKAEALNEELLEKERRAKKKSRTPDCKFKRFREDSRDHRRNNWDDLPRRHSKPAWHLARVPAQQDSCAARPEEPPQARSAEVGVMEVEQNQQFHDFMMFKQFMSMNQKFSHGEPQQPAQVARQLKF